MARDGALEFFNAVKLLKKVAMGEVTMNDLVEDAMKDPEEKKEEARKLQPCTKMVGCTEGYNHKGGCCINVDAEIK